MIKALTAFWRGRKRRQEKARRSQEIESTFSDRLASRSITRSTGSKIDVGFTSEPNLNSEDTQHRPTFSRFFQLWKGLRNSKRKLNAEETRRSVVFTVPTDDIFPKSHTKYQTQRRSTENLDHVVQMDGFVTHLCHVHKMNENAYCTNNEFNQQKEDSSGLESVHTVKGQSNNRKLNELNMGKTTAAVAETKENHKKQNEFYNTSSKNEFEVANVCNNSISLTDMRASGDKNNIDETKNGDVNGFSISKERDVENDSGCGSSCHELACSELPPGGLRLSLKSFGDRGTENTAEIEWPKDQDQIPILTSSAYPSHDELSENSVECNKSTESTKQHTSHERLSEAQLKQQELEEDSFEALIQLAKQGMSDKAREVCEHDENEEIHNKSAALSSNLLIEAVDPLNGIYESIVTTTNGYANYEVKKNMNNIQDIHDIHTRINPSSNSAESARMACISNTHHVDSGVRLSSTHCVLSINDEFNDKSLCVPETGQSSVDGNSPQLANCVDSKSLAGARKMNEINGGNKKSGEGQSRKFHWRKQKQVFFESTPTDGQHSVACSHETSTLNCDKSSDSFQDILRVPKVESSETFLSVERLTPRNKQGALGEDITINDVAKENIENGLKATQVMGSTTTVGTNVCDLKVPSFETFDLASQNSSDQGKRIRSFSATIRRKFSFRSRRSSDDMDVVGSCSTNRSIAKTKKIKAFGSFRVNKKGKASSNDSRTWGFESAEAKGYRSTFDKIFSEDTESVVFSDVPFTIPEIND